ncbi:MAG TPA: 1,6-anhydro-N-acetylmuramyl-L-alanine amidase AmpD [Burkholderiales bacterium]|nr:1,6-anhydro-N-acetylmuramyl-L-alanine amidase AmpD [Burkholderiales bacterium]
MSADGLASGVPFVPSPNCDERPAGCAIDLLVIHAISLPPGEVGGRAIEDLFLNRLDPSAHPYYADIADLKVSAHFLVRRDGALVQFVSCVRRAWHAGASSWRGRARCNDFSVGIELEGSDDVPFEARQYDSLATLAKSLTHTYAVAEIVGHSDIAPGRKTDPGPHFDWERFRAALNPKVTRPQR